MQVKRIVGIAVAVGLTTLGLGSGCSLAPKSFRDMLHPAPVVRARAVGLDGKQPDPVAVPALIDRLSDPDQVVRMTANDGLKERTGQDFGFVAWAPVGERAEAVARWRTWWRERAGRAAYPKDDNLRRVAAESPRSRRTGRKRLPGRTPTPWTSSPIPEPATPDSP